MRDHRRTFERIWLAKWIVGIVNVVLSRDDVDAAREQLLDACNPAPLWFAVEPRGAHKVDVRIGRNCDAGSRYHVDDLCGVDIVIASHGAAVTRCHAAV